MLTDAEVSLGFSVDDLERAKTFYGQTLGLEVAEVSLGVEGSDVPTGLELRLAGGAESASIRRLITFPPPSRS